MASDTLGTAPGAAPAADNPPQDRPRWRRGHLATPLFLAAVVLALYGWLAAADLDSIEARVLTGDAIVTAAVQHLEITAIATLVVVAIAIPLGVLLTRRGMRWLTPGALALANIGQAAPALGILVILAMVFEVGRGIAIAALVISAVLPVLRNTIVGIQQVDATLVEAAAGMGLRPRQVLARVELPLAVPVLLAGVRSTLVICVGVTTVATFVNAGGLGDVIVVGIKTTRTPVLVTGAVLTAVIALGLDWLAGLLEHLLRPRGV
ncbi:ABC transporter permease [Streptomyces sp. NPDC051218]|uniref:ABC transporter permease n=1 Tax=Streptomyces sp. NPDC051218 TaxID=3365645 RepID=UPI0037B7F640